MADPFDTLGLLPTFDLDAATLRHAYLARVAAMHPDSTGASADPGRQPAALNDAKRVLEDPERRANALLVRLGGPTKEQDRSLPPSFLADIMELRERVEGALASADPEIRAAIERDAVSRREAHISRVAALFHIAYSGPNPETLTAVRTELNAWRYIERLIEQLDPGYDPTVADFSHAPRDGSDST